MEHVASGTDLFRAICELDMEGVVAKQAAGLYTPGQGDDFGIDTVYRDFHKSVVFILIRRLVDFVLPDFTPKVTQLQNHAVELFIQNRTGNGSGSAGAVRGSYQFLSCRSVTISALRSALRAVWNESATSWQ